MILFDNVTKEYKSKEEDTVCALKKLRLHINEKGLVAITGASGCGKTTLLNLLSGFDRPTYGTILVDGIDIFSLSDSEWDDFRAKEIGFVFQDFNLLDELNVKENIELPLKLIGVDEKEIEKKVEDIADKVKITDLLVKNVKHLSGGQKQRVALARAVVKSPRFILADEPTGNLDKKNSVLVFEMLKQISQDCFVLVVTHDTALATQYADRIIQLSYGEIVDDSVASNEIVKEISEQKTNSNKEKSHLPTSFCVGYAGILLQNRIVRTCITMFMLTITISLALIVISFCTKDKGNSIFHYLRKNPMDIAMLSIPATENASDFIPNGNQNLRTGITIKNTIENTFDDEKICYLGIERLEGIEIIQSIGTSMKMVEPLLVLGSLPKDDNEILINSSFYYGFSERPLLPFDLELELCTKTVVGVVSDIGISGIEKTAKTIVCSKESALKNYTDYGYASGIGYTVESTPISQYCLESSFNSIDVVSDSLICGRMPENVNEVLLSKEYVDIFRLNISEVLNKEQKCFDLYDSQFGQLFLSRMNLFDYCGESVVVTGIVEGDEHIYFQDDVFKRIDEDSSYFRINYGIWLSQKEYKKTTQKIIKTGLILEDEHVFPLYSVWKSIESYLLIPILLFVVLSIITLLQMITLFSFSIKDSSKKIGIFRALGVPQKNVRAIFIFESLFTSFFSAILSIALMAASLGAINKFLSLNYYSGMQIKTICVNFFVMFSSFCILVLGAAMTVLIPLRKMRKATIVKLLNMET